MRKFSFKIIFKQMLCRHEDKVLIKREGIINGGMVKVICNTYLCPTCYKQWTEYER